MSFTQAMKKKEKQKCLLIDVTKKALQRLRGSEEQRKT